MRTPEEQALIEDFGAQYRRHQSPVWQAIERRACGCACGGTSWTTQDEADWICDLLGLRSGQRLLQTARRYVQEQELHQKALEDLLGIRHVSDSHARKDRCHWRGTVPPRALRDFRCRHALSDA